MSFAHLRVHSNFSMLAGTRRVEDLVRAAAGAGMPALALADTDGMCAVVPFARACAEAGVRPVYGVEITERGGARSGAEGGLARGAGPAAARASGESGPGARPMQPSWTRTCGRRH